LPSPPIVKGGRGIGTASIASIVRIGGTLGSAALGLDSVGVAKSAVGAGVALVATPWWLAEAVLKQLSSDPHPCATALAKLQGGHGGAGVVLPGER